jgi:hypothetical protein
MGASPSHVILFIYYEAPKFLGFLRWSVHSATSKWPLAWRRLPGQSHGLHPLCASCLGIFSTRLIGFKGNTDVLSLHKMDKQKSLNKALAYNLAVF